MSTTPLRVGDAERSDAAEQLQKHFTAGRITWDELDERLGHAYSARTEADLTTLFTDLPRNEPLPDAPSHQRRQSPVTNSLIRRALVLYLVMALVIAATIVRDPLPLVIGIWVIIGIASQHRHRGAGSGRQTHSGGRHHGRPHHHDPYRHHHSRWPDR